jgi:hypothetical protein
MISAFIEPPFPRAFSVDEGFRPCDLCNPKRHTARWIALAGAIIHVFALSDADKIRKRLIRKVKMPLQFFNRHAFSVLPSCYAPSALTASLENFEHLPCLRKHLHFVALGEFSK